MFPECSLNVPCPSYIVGGERGPAGTGPGDCARSDWSAERATVAAVGPGGGRPGRRAQQASRRRLPHRAPAAAHSTTGDQSTWLETYQ